MRAITWLLPALLAGPVAAQPAITRLGTHGGFGRVVFEFRQWQDFTAKRDGNTLELSFPSAGDIADAAGTARNVAGVTGGSSMATITVGPGARIKTMRLGSRIVVDVLDPSGSKPPANGVTHGRLSASAASGSVEAGHTGKSFGASQHFGPAIEPLTQKLIEPDAARSQPLSKSAVPSLPAVNGQMEPVSVTSALNQPAASLAIVASSSPADLQQGVTHLPFGPQVAAASFRHGDETWIVFDDRRPLDLASLASDPAYKGAAVELLPSATLLTMQTPGDHAVGLRSQPEGWSVVVNDGSQNKPALFPTAQPDRLLFPLPSPGRVLTIPDPSTGRNLLVGTVRMDGPGVPVTIRTPELVVLPSSLGVVVEPISDRVAMRAVPDGLIVETGAPFSTNLDGSGALAGAAMLTRRFDFPVEPVVTLLRRLQAQMQEEGQAPPQARLSARKNAAQTMIALGLGPEAQSLLRLATNDDPRAASDPDVKGLSAIAALLSSRFQEADYLDQPELDGTDDVTFWRALRKLMTDGGSAGPARALATTAKLVLAYPDALRNRLLPMVAEALVAGDAPGAADALLDSLPDDPTLAFARAARFEKKGDVASAITLFDALARNHDRFTSARATDRALALRLETGAISAAEASERLEQSFANWRGDKRERDLRL